MDLFSKLKTYNLLLIDDDEWIRDSMTLFFEGENCRIKTLETAEEGLKELEKNNYDIIFIDYKLPGMNGMAFLKKIEKSHPDTFKILITAYGYEVFQTATKEKIHAVITKPFSSEEILACLNRLLKP